MKSLSLMVAALMIAGLGCKKAPEPEAAPAPPTPKSAGVSVDGADPAAPPADAAPPPPAPAEPTENADAGADPNAKPMNLPPELVQLRKMCDKYFNENGSFPNRWEDLINARYIAKVPLKPDGKPWGWVEFTRAVANP